MAECNSGVRRDRNGLTEAEFLSAYRPKDYPRPSVTADVVAFRRAAGALSLLLIRRGAHPFLGLWALPGGFAHPGETLEETARREFEEETGLTGGALRLVGLFSAPDRDPRGWTMSAAYATVLDAPAAATAGDDAADAAWFRLSREETPAGASLRLDGPESLVLRPDGARALAFDHAEIIARALAVTDLRPPSDDGRADRGGR